MLQRRRRFPGLARISEPLILFPALATLLLAIIWGSTVWVVRVKYADAERAAADSSRDLLNTYQAQVVRALREIDQTLNLVRFWPGRSSGMPVLPVLRNAGLLPPGLLFTVSIADRNGAVRESTSQDKVASVADQAYFQAQRDHDTFFIGRLPAGPVGDSKLQFSRRLTKPDGSFDGVVIVSVDAAYFVSNYEKSFLGEHGVVGIIGSDGIFRVRRTGDATFSGETTDYHSLVPNDEPSSAPPVIRCSWDGVRRWVSARKLYGFPLAVLAGLSVDEQMAAVHRQARTYLVWAGIGSVLVVLITALLGRVTWELAQARLRESEARLAHAQQVEYLAYHDGLTRLPNRSLFSKLLGQSLSEARRYQRNPAVLFLDLDRFKQINDTLGHEAGDQLLREVATRLRACVRTSDTVARLGGDEFVILLPELTSDQDATTIANKILTATAKPFVLLGHEFFVTSSIGISRFPQDGLDEQTLQKNADIAMYHAKSEGKNNFQFYSQKLTAQSLERRALESSLRVALERQEFRVHYQAKRDISTGRITGMEALLRWQHPDLGLLAPMQFIPVAEETGLIVPIGRWVLQTACAQCAAWQREGTSELSVAVNLTARQFRDPQLLVDVGSILAATGLPSRMLELELHESLLVHEVERTLGTLTRLKALGVRIAIDDFGTGYSSLAMLQRFPLDTIKIDRSIIRSFVDSGSNDLAEAVIAMGKSLSLTLVAQGVETQEQAQHLRTSGCDELQGFYLNRPMSAGEFSRLLREETCDGHLTPL